MAKIKNPEKTKKKIKKGKTFKTKHYPCSYCSKTFSERAGRDHHLQLHSSERPFSCSLCPHTCKTKKYLAKHVRVVHKPPTSFKCEYCDKMFHYKCILDKHIVIHTNSKPHKCKDCGKGFNSQYSLKTHALIHKNLKPFKCKYCDYACRDSSTLRRHHERHQGIVTRHRCNICDKEFSAKQALQYHVAEVHMNVDLKKIPCELCDQMFKTKSALTRHVAVKHNRKFATTCEICGAKISSKYNMNSHLMTHVDVRPYKCAFDGCDKRYKDKSSLQKHTIIHYPEKQFPCKVCGKKFTRRVRLRRHKKQHVARVKNVQCDYCGVRFYNKSYLRVHIRKKHPRRKRKYICDMCDFECGNKPGLIRHIKGHSRRSNKECPICTRKYKEDNWLKIHLWQAHKVMASTGTPTFATDVKVEPLDADGTPEFELFEIEKEEVLDELHSMNERTNTENNVTETIADGYNAAEEENDNILTRVSDSVNNNSNKESSQAVSKENGGVQLSESLDISLHNYYVSESISKVPRKVVLSVSDNLRIVCNNSIDNTANETLMTDCEELVVENGDNEKSITDSKCVQIENNIGQVIEDENYCQNLVDLNSTKSLEQNDELQINVSEHNSQIIALQNNHRQVNSVKIIKSVIHKANSKGKSLAQLKARLEQKQKKLKKETKHLGLHRKPPKQKSLAHIKIALLNKEQSEKDQRVTTESLSDSEELEQGLEYSKTVLSEDIARCMTQKKQKDPSEKNFDDFLIQHITSDGKKDKSSHKSFATDKECESYAKSYVDKLLKKTRNDNEVKLIEKTRQQYNERIRKARKMRPEKVSIKYFDKVNLKNTVKEDQEEDNAMGSIINNERENDGDLRTTQSAIKYDDKDKCEEYNSLNDSTEVKDPNIDEEVKNDEAEQFSNEEFDQDQSADIDMINTKGENETYRIKLRSVSNNKNLQDDQSANGKVKSVDEFRKIKLNTHQCYVCFKLFPSKDKLLDHCKDHFEVCNSTILKKCPLCDYATKLNIVQHMKNAHDVIVTIPSTRILDKESDSGPRYCYKVNSETITDIDVIPSVKHLNKQAYIAIDKKNRKLKDTGIAKTKLVKKGNEWIVERQTTKIDNVEEFILPEFDVDEILSIKIDSNDYLSRMKKLYRLAKKYKKRMLFPCENCDKICHTLSALKLHCRRHDPKSKPFKKKVWKHKMKDLVQSTNKKVTDIDYGKKKYSRVVEIDKKDIPGENINDNRYKKPRPVVNKHKCDPELIKFYENNIKGGDIEFWQFLKIFNKMSRENVNDFDDLMERPEFGIHSNPTRTEDDRDLIENKNEDNTKAIESNDSKNIDGNRPKRTPKITNNNRFKRIIRISKKDYQRRNEAKQKLRERIAKERLGNSK